MEKASAEMDLEEWEILPDDGFLDFHHKAGKETLPNRKSGRHRLQSPDNSSVPVPIHLELMVEKSPNQESEKVKDLKWVGEHDQDMISQVFFKKMEEIKFVDMKMDSPKSGGGRGLTPQIDLGAIQFEEGEEEEEACKSEDFDPKQASEEETGNEYEKGSKAKGNGCWEGHGLNIWRWSVTGIGALCSMGVAAASICIFILGSHQRQKQLNQNQKLQFQIYEEDKVFHLLHQT